MSHVNWDRDQRTLIFSQPDLNTRTADHVENQGLVSALVPSLGSFCFFCFGDRVPGYRVEWVSLVREPVARKVSEYNYLRWRPTRPHGLSSTDKLRVCPATQGGGPPCQHHKMAMFRKLQNKTNLSQIYVRSSVEFWL